ncbi:hypothetical protein [Methanosphaerula subterraneus]|uniref:ATP-binding protein n=1 Tax=Methanosphaerula subterraneus TaxID=3350244 RepID=UPI003F85119C
MLAPSATPWTTPDRPDPGPATPPKRGVTFFTQYPDDPLILYTPGRPYPITDAALRTVIEEHCRRLEIPLVGFASADRWDKPRFEPWVPEPFRPASIVPGTRTVIVIGMPIFLPVVETDLCTCCLRCARLCPAGALEAGDYPDMLADKRACTEQAASLAARHISPCGRCIAVCPVGEDRCLFAREAVGYRDDDDDRHGDLCRAWRHVRSYGGD